MNQKLEELTEKLYKEGVVKGNSQANEIIESAKIQADKITIEAKQQAERLLNEAHKEIEELKKSTESELRISSLKTYESLKQSIVEIINAQAIDQLAISTSEDENFLKDALLKIFENWSPSKEEFDFNILISKDMEGEILKGFSKEIKTILNKGITIKSDQWQMNGFSLQPADGSYKVKFSDENFAEFFKEFLRPKLKSILFENKK